MSEAALTSWDAVFAFALALPGVELSPLFGKPAIKLAANGRSFVYRGHEPDTSFAVEIDRGTVEVLKATDPATFWQTPHYEGWSAVLVRFDSMDPERVRDVVRRAHAQAAAKKPVRPRRK